MGEKLIFEKSHQGKKGYTLPKNKINMDINLDDKFLRDESIGLPQVSEQEVLRHYINLSTLNHHVDKGFYPLGSCTMKYNPKLNEKVAALSGFSEIHPLQPVETVQGALEVYYETAEMLAEVSGI